MKKKIITMTILLALALAFVGYCIVPFINQHKADEKLRMELADEKLSPLGPTFNADSAYAFVAAQCQFGPRAMNTAGHEQCAQWIKQQFQRYGCQVEMQQANLTGYDGTTLKATNIIARINPETSSRILLCAHWDSRPWADNDPDEANWRKPILAANDAASGVAVMLELARVLSADSTFRQGIDFVCFDAEDWGTPQWADVPDDPSSWALGAQHFAENLPDAAYNYGILLDMVGGQQARFYREAFSQQYAQSVVKRIWRAARRAGFAEYFPKKDGGMVTDDHVPLCRRGIPVADIIPFYPNCRESSFGPTWHTLADDLEHIDRNTLKAVGQTIVQVLYD